MGLSQPRVGIRIKGYDGEVCVPHALVGIILHIVWLDNRSIAAPAGFTGDPLNSFVVDVPTIAGLYNFPPNLSAADQTTGISILHPT